MTTTFLEIVSAYLACHDLVERLSRESNPLASVEYHDARHSLHKARQRLRWAVKKVQQIKNEPHTTSTF